MRSELRPVDLARAVGMSVQTVRRYERFGLLPPAVRTAGGHRRYGLVHLAALHLVTALGEQTSRRVLACVHRGDIDAALALLDERHAAIHDRRRLALAAVAAVREIAGDPAGRVADPGAGAAAGLIGVAAAEVGVSASVLRSWEQRGLLRPAREAGGGVRQYGGADLTRARLLALLRRAGFDYPAVHAVVRELDAGRVDAAAAVAAIRLDDIAAQSRRCAAATASLWEYLSRRDGEPGLPPGRPAPLTGRSAATGAATAPGSTR